MKKIAFLISCALLACSCAHQRNYTVIVSLDAFRWDYPDIFETPWLDSIARAGVKATMSPSYPSSTFPNHYTLATGLRPDHHGIVNSSFWDRDNDVMYSMGDSTSRNVASYYGGEPIWTTAQKQGLRTANLYWVGSDIPIKGVLPTSYRYWYDDPRLDYAGRMDETLRLLGLPENERPSLIMTYIDDPDMTTHEFGPESVEGGIMVHYLDSLVGVLYKGIKALPYGDRVNLIVTADHGMTDISDERFVGIGDYVRDEWVEKVVGTNPTSIFCKPGCRDSLLAVLKDVEHIQAWKKEEVPASLVYGSSPMLGDVIVAPDPMWQFAWTRRSAKGAHGFDPEFSDMQVAFRAAGPDFKKGYEKPDVFPNVDIYPLLARLLCIRPEPVDGCIDDVEDMLAR